MSERAEACWGGRAIPCSPDTQPPNPSPRKRETTESTNSKGFERESDDKLNWASWFCSGRPGAGVGVLERASWCWSGRPGAGVGVPAGAGVLEWASRCWIGRAGVGVPLLEWACWSGPGARGMVLASRMVEPAARWSPGAQRNGFCRLKTGPRACWTSGSERNCFGGRMVELGSRRLGRVRKPS